MEHVLINFSAEIMFITSISTPVINFKEEINVISISMCTGYSEPVNAIVSITPNHIFGVVMGEMVFI